MAVYEDYKYIPIPTIDKYNQFKTIHINQEIDVPEILTTFKKVSNGWILNNNDGDIFNMSNENDYYLFHKVPITDNIKRMINVVANTNEIMVEGTSDSASDSGGDGSSGSDSGTSDRGGGDGSSGSDSGTSGSDSGGDGSSGGGGGGGGGSITKKIMYEGKEILLKKDKHVLLKVKKNDGTFYDGHEKIQISDITSDNKIIIKYRSNKCNAKNKEIKWENGFAKDIQLTIKEFLDRKPKPIKLKVDNINHSSAGKEFNLFDYPESSSTFDIKKNVLFTTEEESDAIKLQTMLKPIYDIYQGFINYYKTNPEFKVIETFKGLSGGSGNTCWMNALFQVLIFHTEVLTEFLYNNGTPLRYRNSKFINLFSDIVIDYKKTTTSLTNLSNIEKELSNEKVFKKIFDTGRHQDAAEGLVMFDDIFEKEPYYKNNIDYSSISIDEKNILLLTNKAIYCSFINYLFLNIENSYVICSNEPVNNTFLETNFLSDNNNKVRDESNIKKVTEKYIISHNKQSIQTLEFPLNSKIKMGGNFTLNKLIETYQEFEELDSSNYYHECQDIGTKTIKKIDIDLKSKYIIIQLKRFEYGTIANKINDIVELEDITNFNNLSSIDYRLYGIVCHSGIGGKDGGSGHYVSFVKINKTKKKVIYTLCDGSNISGNYTIDKIWNDTSRTPYLLFYERLD